MQNTGNPSMVPENISPQLGFRVAPRTGSFFGFAG